jgi:hypothetical protein
MTLARKVNELMQGRILVKNENEKIILPVAEVTVEVVDAWIRKYFESHKSGNISSGGYNFKEYLNNDVSNKQKLIWLREKTLAHASLIEVPIIEGVDIIASEIYKKMYSFDNDPIAMFNHEVYGNLKRESHYLEFEFSSGPISKEPTSNFRSPREKNSDFKYSTMKGILQWYVLK